jgi:hypothetical protein
MEIELELGIKAKDPVTGFEGTVVGQRQFLHQNEEWLIQPLGLDPSNGEVIASFWFPVKRLEIVDQ